MSENIRRRSLNTPLDIRGICVKELFQLQGYCSPNELLKHCTTCNQKISMWKKNDEYTTTCWFKAANCFLRRKISGSLQYLYLNHCDFDNSRPDAQIRKNIVRKIADSIIKWSEPEATLISRKSLALWYLIAIESPKVEPLHAAVAVKQLEFCILIFLKQNGEQYDLKLTSEPDFFTYGYEKYKLITTESNQMSVDYEFIESIVTVEEIECAQLYLSQSEKKMRKKKGQFLSANSLVIDERTPLYQWNYMHLMCERKVE